MSPLALLWGQTGSAIFLSLLTLAAVSCMFGPVYANHLHQQAKIVSSRRVLMRSAVGAYALTWLGIGMWALYAAGILVVTRK